MTLQAPRPPAPLPVTPQAAAPPRYLNAVVRVSKIYGRDGEGFISPEVQRATIQGYADAHDMEIRDWFEELDKSGKTTNRLGLMAALDDVHAGGADGIICASVDRYSRSLSEGLNAIHELDRAGKAFIAVREGIEPGMSQRSFGWFMLSFLLMLAEWQLRVITENWLTARRKHVTAGIANQTPYGYLKRDAKEADRPRRLDPDPATAPWVVSIFEMRAGGSSWGTIAGALQDAGVPSPGGCARWGHNRLSAVVANRTYLGEITSGEFVNVAAHEPLVTIELWERANAAFVTGRTQGENYLLTGLVRCALCGGRMRGTTEGRNAAGEPARYYACRKRYGWGLCRGVNVPAGRLEAYVVEQFWVDHREALEAVGIDDDLSDALTTAQDDLADAETDLREFRDSPTTAKMRKRLGQAWVDEGIEVRADRVGVAMDAVTAALAAKRGVNVPADLEVRWDDLDFEVQRGFLADAFAVIAVRSDTGWRSPMAERARIWRRNEPGTPQGLPGRGAGTERTPIDF